MTRSDCQAGYLWINVRMTRRILNATFYHQRSALHWHETVDWASITSMVAKDETNGSLYLTPTPRIHVLHHNILCSIILHTIFYILGLYESMSQLDPTATQVKRPQYPIGLRCEYSMQLFTTRGQYRIGMLP